MDDSVLNHQKVGELFVVQYYTQMHKDPAQMHRFYQDESSFAHGGHEMGSEEPVIGQKAIHKKILSLQLQQVHTKIRQVDSHPTISNSIAPGIVVQVTGELSVAGEPMRPFVQTFVLAPESQKKYYIHNDIFRYQVYDEDLVSESEANETQIEQETNIPDLLMTKESLHSPTIPEEGLYHSNEANLPPGVITDQSGKDSPVLSGNVNHPDVPVPNTSWSDHYDDTLPLAQSNGLPDEAHVTLGEEPTNILEDEEEEDNVDEEDTGHDMEEFSSSTDQSTKPPPGTWASRISQSMPSSSKPQTTSFNQTTKSVPPQPRIPNNLPSTSQPLPQREGRPPRKQERPMDKKPIFTHSNIMNPRSAPDSFQIFVGGLPPGTSEEELKDVFSQFGTIIEVRINPKNFGFIVFDNEQSVHSIISSRHESPITLRDKKLNIEEKRPSAPRGGGGMMGPSAGSRKPPPVTGGVGGKSRTVNRPPRRT